MRTENFGETKEYFRREIRINQLFTKCYKEDGKLSVPKFIKGDAEHIPEWMVYEFIEGHEAGDFYNGLESDNIERISLESLMKGIENMHRMSALAQGEIKLVAEKYENFKVAYQKNSKVLKPFFTEKEIKTGFEILESRKRILDTKNKTITHGDLHPGNLIIKKKNDIAIIDWYYVHLNNVAFDIAFFFLEISDKKFQNKVLEKFVSELVDDENEFWQLFRLNILRLAPQKISVLRDALYVAEPVKEDYYAKLTPKGVAKLEVNLEAFQKALLGNDFL